MIEYKDSLAPPSCTWWNSGGL